MSEFSENIWRAKAAAWVHDPGEKQIILFARSHEGGTVKRLTELLLETVEPGTGKVREKADHWSSAADRPQFPKEAEARVVFRSQPVLVHPLCGIHYDLKASGGEGLSFDAETLDSIETKSFSAANELIKQAIGKSSPEIVTTEDLRKALLALWRFLPQQAPEGFGELWGLLPADSRVPDHAIWAHLDLASALAGAMAGDANGEVALLMVSLGPVQEFIAQARSTSDLWAGSHLLSSLTMAAMEPVLERLGPDAVIFPHLRGVPQVDLWLIRQGLREEMFDGEEWRSTRTDFNPLFMAALPNLFLAIVPRDQAETLAQEAAERARTFMRSQVAEKALEKLLSRFADIHGDKLDDTSYPYEQLERQLKDFPEVYWAVAPWARKGEDYGKAKERLQKILSTFSDKQEEPGIFSHDGFKRLAQKIEADIFEYAPNPGVLYPAAHEAVSKAHGAVKTLRPFGQAEERGYRCSLCGEREWLTLDPAQLQWTARQREENARKDQPTLWSNVKPSWAKKGEHLCAICASKRLWPGIFRETVKGHVKDGNFSRRFVVSTHVLAMADDLEDLILKNPGRIVEAAKNYPGLPKADTSALPRLLMKKLPKNDPNKLAELVKQIPSYIDDLRNTEDRDTLDAFLQDIGLQGHERYYAVLLMDGDNMGAWLSGDKKHALKFADAFHPDIRRKAEEVAAQGKDAVRNYLEAPRPPSPARHVSISTALNNFSLHLARVVVEELCNGKLIYAGGDDVLALLTVEDALKAATALRFLYSGHVPKEAKSLLPEEFDRRFKAKNGYVKYRDRLLLTMGPTATASAGLVIAHAMTPLSRVLGEVRKAEKRAKEGGRNALSITVMKRAGNIARITGQWPAFTVASNRQEVEEEQPFPLTMPGLLARLSAEMRANHLSRRAPYHVFQRLEKLPPRKLSGLAPDAWNEMLKSMLVHQFLQQKQPGADEAQLKTLATDIAAWVCDDAHDDPLHTLREFLGVAEFLGRRNREETDTDETPGSAGTAEEAAA